MIHYLLVLLLGLQVVAQHYCEDGALQQYEHSRTPQLQNGHIETELMPEDRQFNVVIDVPYAEELLVRVFLYMVSVYSLLEVAHEFGGMLEDFANVGIIASPPLGLPQEVNDLHLGDDLGVHIFEMEHICAIFRDVLDMRIDFMYSRGAVLDLIEELLQVHHRVNWIFLVLFHSVDPYIDIAVAFCHRVFPKRSRRTFLISDPVQLLTLLAEVFVVLDIEHLHGLVVVIYIYIAFYLRMCRSHHRTAIHGKDTGCTSR